jgi:O-antigen ligase
MLNYVINWSNSQTYRKVLAILLFVFIFSLFFPIRHVFHTPEANLSGIYSDFTSFSLYLSDILLFCLFLMVVIPRWKDFYHVVKPLIFFSLWVILVFLVFFSLNTRLNTYFLIKWLELIVAYGTLKLVFEQKGLKMGFLKIFTWFCGLQSVIALAQFVHQSPLGLFRLGESHIGPAILGVAKIVSGGTTFIRGYGTFPHPNPLSAFLVGGTLISIYLLTIANRTISKFSYSLLLFLNILGLTVTFSRGAYISLALGLIIFFGFLIYKHSVIARSASDEAIFPNKKIASAALAMTVLLTSIAFSFFLFKPFLLTRATFSDQATMDRKFYDRVGVKMAEKNPIFGVGLGESLLMMEKYSQKTLAPWDKQPPHNYFIIAAAELGIPAMLFLAWFFLNHLWQLFKKLKSESNPQLTTYYLLLTTILATFLILMQFDHYFYDIEQTRLLLWTILALTAAEIKNPQRGESEIPNI